MQSTILVILPTWAVFLLFLSLPLQILPKSTLSQRTVNKTSWNDPRQTQICYIFRLWVIVKALLKQISLYLLSHFRIRIIVVTCRDNKSARNHQAKSCVHTKSHKSQWCGADTRADIISIEIFAPFVCSCSCENSRVPPLNRYKAVDRNFVPNGGTTFDNTDAFVALQLGWCFWTNR